MHIKYITNVRMPTPRAQGYAIMKMCSEFAKLGNHVELFIPNRKNKKNSGNPFEFYKIKENFKINKIPSFDLLGKTLKFGRFFYWIDILSFLSSSKFAVRLKNDDILYTRDFLVALAFSKNNFICLELHDIPTNKVLFKKAITKPRLFFVLNQNIKNELVKIGVSPDKIHISPSGVEIKDFDIEISKEEARQKLNLSKDKKIVLYSGQLYSWKGADTLAKVAKLLPEYFFVFVGGVEPEISEFRKNYGDLKNIKIIPSVERELVPIYLKSADCLVVPNSAKEKISTHFTSPLKLIEYMASKRPIVASNLPSIREVVSEDSVIFAEPDNPKSFADSIIKILSDEKLSTKIIAEAFKSVQKFSWEIRSQNIVKEIKKNVF